MKRKYEFKEFADRLSRAIYDSGKSQRAVGMACGICEGSIYQYTEGTSLPNAYVLAMLFAVVGVSADYLLFGDKNDKG